MSLKHFLTPDGNRKLNDDAQIFVDRFLHFHVKTGVTSVGTIGMVGSLLRSGQFLCSIPKPKTSATTEDLPTCENPRPTPK